MTDHAPVRIEREGRTLWIVLDRPRSRNAVNLETARLLGSAIEELSADPEIFVGVIRGEGPAFCAGQDLKAIAAGEPLVPPERPEWGWAGVVGHPTPKPLIAAVHGFALGGGLELALACDVVVASSTTRFALPEVTRGLFAAGGGVPRLAQQMPPKVAARYAFTGEHFSGEQARDWGLVSELVAEDDDVLPAARHLAARIAANAPMAVQATKKILAESFADSLWQPTEWTAIDAAVRTVFSSADAVEGATAFAEKRQPIWTGR